MRSLDLSRAVVVGHLEQLVRWAPLLDERNHMRLGSWPSRI